MIKPIYLVIFFSDGQWHLSGSFFDRNAALEAAAAAIKDKPHVEYVRVYEIHLSYEHIIEQFGWIDAQVYPVTPQCAYRVATLDGKAGRRSTDVKYCSFDSAEYEANRLIKSGEAIEADILRIDIDGEHVVARVSHGQDGQPQIRNIAS